MRVLYISLIVVIIDQLSKLKVKGIKIPALGINVEGMTLGSSINLIGDFFKLTFIENPGMAFGIEFGGKLTLSIFTLIATFLIIYFIYKNKNEGFYFRASLAFILGGAVGNLIDRLFYGAIFGYAPIFYGKVVDFFHFNIPDFNLFGKTFYSWPIFNVADISVTIGFLMVLLGYSKIFNKKSADESTGTLNSEDNSDVTINRDTLIDSSSVNQLTVQPEHDSENK